ncbi:MAG: DNA polymerase III subunit gamma/tau [Alphaproteobacteria bacterium]
MSLFPAAALPDSDPVPGGSAAPYRVLARKYRPKNFQELIGQEVVVRTLTHAIKAGRLAQAWMLTGVRGVGKTTTARIIARALNCTGPDGKGEATPDPCGVCGNCVAIAADRHVDVLEMDAASRTGVDDIREIVDGVRYNPVNARYKVYIIDEVHMLSKNAFNALLKTLEEPPPHVKFIFATTEVRKVPVTVLSRCQRFDLRRVDAETLIAHFAGVAKAEETSIEPEALALIARAADGSVRDGLSLLDQAIARGGESVTAAAVQEMLGLADRTRVMDLARHIFFGEMREGIGVYDDMQQSGADPLVLLQDMAELTHLLTRAKLAPDMAQGSALPEIEKQFIAASGKLEIPALTRAWQILLKGIGEVQAAAHPAQAAEMVLIRLAYAASLPPPADLIRKLQQDQAAASAPSPSGGPGHGGGPVAMMTRGNVALAVRNPQPVAAPAADLQIKPPMAMPDDFRALVAMFAEGREVKLYGELYQFAHPVKLEPGKLELFLDPHASPDLASRAGACLTAWTGQRWLVTLARDAGAPTLATLDAEREAAEREAILGHPLVQTALGLFPGAKLGKIRYAVAPPESKPAAENETDSPLEPVFDPTEE